MKCYSLIMVFLRFSLYYNVELVADILLKRAMSICPMNVYVKLSFFHNLLVKGSFPRQWVSEKFFSLYSYVSCLKHFEVWKQV